MILSLEKHVLHRVHLSEDSVLVKGHGVKAPHIALSAYHAGSEWAGFWRTIHAISANFTFYYVC